MMTSRQQALQKLQRSKFRASFHLRETDRAYVRRLGMDAIRTHAQEFVAQRLAPAYPLKDGKQTPMRGHPVFIAQHATATCCRGCLNKWYHVPQGIQLTSLQQAKIVNLILSWIEMEMTTDPLHLDRKTSEKKQED